MFTILVEEIQNSNKPNNGTFLQTPFWCEFKTRHGWTYKRFKITYTLKAETQEEECSNNQRKQDLVKTFELAVLNRSFCKNKFSIAYIPLMPELPFECTSTKCFDDAFDSENQEEILKEEPITAFTQQIEFAYLLNDLAKALKPFLQKNTIALRFDPQVIFDNPQDRDMFNSMCTLFAKTEKLNLQKNKVDIQPPDSTLVDLTGTIDQILSKMHSKWRYNIRLSEKKGVKIHKYSGNSLNLSTKIDKFYELTKETNARDGNSSHAKSYYLDLIQSSAQKIQNGDDVPLVNLYIAEHEGDEIASIMTLFSKDEAIYLYGASSNLKRNLMPNHLLQWTAMQDAKAYGCKYYDMYGMPPEGKNENHPMHGLYMFKANFGGKIIHRTGSWDVPLKKVYTLYKIAEKLRAFFYKVILKKIRGR